MYLSLNTRALSLSQFLIKTLDFIWQANFFLFSCSSSKEHSDDLYLDSRGLSPVYEPGEVSEREREDERKGDT